MMAAGFSLLAVASAAGLRSQRFLGARAAAEAGALHVQDLSLNAT